MAWLKIHSDFAQELANYLVQRPYFEVADLVTGLVNLPEIEEDEDEKLTVPESEEETS